MGALHGAAGGGGAAAEERQLGSEGLRRGAQWQDGDSDRSQHRSVQKQATRGLEGRCRSDLMRGILSGVGSGDNLPAVFVGK